MPLAGKGFSQDQPEGSLSAFVCNGVKSISIVGSPRVVELDHRASKGKREQWNLPEPQSTTPNWKTCHLHEDEPIQTFETLPKHLSSHLGHLLKPAPSPQVLTPQPMPEYSRNDQTQVETVPTAQLARSIVSTALEEGLHTGSSESAQEEMSRTWPGSPNYQTTKWPHRTSPIVYEHFHEPVVVNRLVPEYGVPSSTIAIPGLGLQLPGVNTVDTKKPGNGREMWPKDVDLPHRLTSYQNRSLLPVFDETVSKDEVLTVTPSSPSPQADPPSTNRISNGPDTAGNAAHSSHLLDTAYSTFLSKGDEMYMEAAPSAAPDFTGCHKLTGYRSSFHRSRPLELRPHHSQEALSHHYLDQEMQVKKPSPSRSELLSPAKAESQATTLERALTTMPLHHSKDLQVRSPYCPETRETSTRHDTTRPSYRRSALEREGPSLDIPLAEHSINYGLEAVDGDGETRSPYTDEASELGSEEEAYETPMTSPESSPRKAIEAIWRRERVWSNISQVDGGGSQDGGSNEAGNSDADAMRTIPENGEMFEDGSGTVLNTDTAEEKLSSIGGEPLSDDYFMLTNLENISTASDSSDADDVTPLVPASPAKGAISFPFPPQCRQMDPISSIARQRDPSTLLRQCERNATPRQRRLMANGIHYPDRFIPSRTATPTKQALFLSRPSTKSTPLWTSTFSQGPLEDPFGPASSRRLRMADQYVTARNPPSSARPVGLLATRVRVGSESPSPAQRAASAGTVWTVGGSIVTEGVASTTNGRGGRVTSRTSAPHYTADFLRKNSPSEEEITHGRRLAMAMGIEQTARMIQQVGLSSPKKGPKTENVREWRDGAWEMNGGLTPSNVRSKKTKGVPIIPFRVLDAPALRDDYYCSLLAYSYTLECIAVGLGPHVYLWSETRGKTNIPDSLTAPLGTAHVTSVSFSSQEGGSAILAIGRADGRITLWSPLDRDPRFDSDQPAPVSCVCFRPTAVQRQSLRDSIATVGTEELLVGDEIGCVYYYSIEWPNQDQRDLFDWHGSMTLLARISCHSQQICGMAWSPDGEFFATGGNDNQLILSESKKFLRPSVETGRNSTGTVHVRSPSSSRDNASVAGQGEVLIVAPGQERHIFTLNAAVKAIAFAPWQSTLLAAGGGSNDRCVHFFHTLSGASLATIECHAQVTSLVWSSKRKEIAVTFGFAQPEHPYRVAVFAWPSCRMVVGIPWWGEERALFAVPYPKGPSTGHPHRQGPRQSFVGTGGSKADTEGQPWYGKRTRDEGCLVVATSDASIKFHEIWAERHEGWKKRPTSGTLGGSQILEGDCSPELEATGVIR